MEMKYGGEESRQFVTNLGLVSSNGKWGHDVMTAEWTHHISYDPAIIMVNVHDFDATADNIIERKEFGVSLASEKQGELAKICGNSSGKKVDKIAALQDLGFEFYKAEKVDAYLVKGSPLTMECRLISHEKVGDHVMFIAEVVKAVADESERPAIFRSGTGIFKVGEALRHEKSEERDKEVSGALDRHAKQ